MRRLASVALGIAILFRSPLAVAEPPAFQPLVDATPAGAVLRLPAGTYAGPVTINRPLTIDGSDGATITNGGAGTVVTVHADGVTLRGLTIRDSGHQHQTLDACLRIEAANFAVIKDNIFSGCLVGIDLRHANSNVIRRNIVTGSDTSFDMRGDGIRVWYSHDNKLESNTVRGHRDVLIEYSTGNRLTGNTVIGGRYGTHCMYSSHSTLTGNHYQDNTVGVFSMYSNDLIVQGNRIELGSGPAAMGIGLKEASGLTAEDNDILGNGIGIYLDSSPFDPDRPNLFRANRFAFNATAMLFHTNLEGNIVTGNDFIGNYSQVVVQGGGSATSVKWEGNFWDIYEGFDHTHPGTGDTPFELYAYADRLWADIPAAGFFRGSPVIETLDFLARLAPFSAPLLILRDPAPATRRTTNRTTG